MSSTNSKGQTIEIKIIPYNMECSYCKKEIIRPFKEGQHKRCYYNNMKDSISLPVTKITIHFCSKCKFHSTDIIEFRSHYVSYQHRFSTYRF